LIVALALALVTFKYLKAAGCFPFYAR